MSTLVQSLTQQILIMNEMTQFIQLIHEQEDSLW